LATVLPDLEEGIAAAERLEVALRNFEAVYAEVINSLDVLQRASLDGTLSADHVAWINGQAEAFERLLNDIEDDASLGVIDVEERITQAEAIRDSLATMRGYPGGGGSGGPRRTAPTDKIDEALKVLGLARPVLDWRTIDRRCKELRKKHNTDDPDHRATPELLRENTECMKAINNAMDCLKKYKDRLADVMHDHADAPGPVH